MTQKRKTWNVKMSKRTKTILAIVIVFIIVSFLLTFKVVAKAFTKSMNVLGVDAAVSQVQRVAKTALYAGVGMALIYAGTTFSAVPFVGVGLVVVGAIFLIGASILAWNGRSNKPDGSTIETEL